MALPPALDRAFSDSLALAQRLFTDIGERTHDGVGITRATYGEGEQIAHDRVAAEARTLGLEIATDAAANLYMTLPGRDRARPAMVTGSHLDSVPRGGNYDGLAGVVAGLVCLASLRRAEITPPGDLTVMAIRGEENCWFSAQHIGSRAAFGRLPPDILDRAVRADSGRSLARHMADAGADVEALRGGAAHLKSERLAGFVELHIEQGPVLDEADMAVGIVSAIRGNVRCPDARCVGAYDHAGAVPRRLRRDAVMASAELVAAMEHLWHGIEAEGGDLVMTFGQLGTDPEAHSLTTIPGLVRFTFDARSHAQETLDRVTAEVRRLAHDIGRRRGVSFEFRPFTGAPPAPMDLGLRGKLVEGAKALGMATLELASGPGHDAADFAGAGVPAAMIFVRNRHGSHNPREEMPMDAFAEATRLLLWLLVNPP
ncbi:MAG: Zn-dependent hydrolase [Rhodospirillales bacterium]|nr:Zn-dependent hydrolase [Rhodospirillales bacterium]